MWLLFAAGSAFFAGVTAVLAKCGIQKTDSTVATAIRTIVVLIFAWMMVFVVGSQDQIQSIGRTTLLFLALSGLATGASWLCYFRALQIGDINKVVPIDKSSTVLTILLAFLLLGEPIGLFQGIGVVLIGAGTFLMIEKRQQKGPRGGSGKGWMLCAFGSAMFASLTAILGKVGIQGVESNLGTAIRTGVVLVMAWVMVLVTGKAKAVRQVPRRELIFICLSGIATGASWLCYYRALQDGPASVVAPIDKLSILVTVAFSYLVFHERLTRRSGLGLALIVAGTLAMLI
ncbi:EamA family transporter [Oscillibacter valericigenes]|uniref:EamA family transporter n=1 Tax=Oscillibacter valericigenes TaxID=351091 RepID=UPI00195D78FB|nr:EamA family transporter [Oscillibacter valericigenes]MBM6909178.1 EamA family transporter [Oscillibacter valericigenes]